MNYHVHILKGYGPGTEQIIEKRTHTADSDLEAMRTLRESFHIFAPTASGFSPRRKDGAEIYRWFKTEAQSAIGGKRGGPKREKRPGTK